MAIWTCLSTCYYTRNRTSLLRQTARLLQNRRFYATFNSSLLGCAVQPSSECGKMGLPPTPYFCRTTTLQPHCTAATNLTFKLIENNKVWGNAKVIYRKYSKHWLYSVAHTIDCVCSRMLNHGLFLSLFKLIPCPIHWIVYVLAYLNFIFEF